MRKVKFLSAALRYPIKKHVTLVPVYGIPHSGGGKSRINHNDFEENTALQKMSAIQDCIKNTIKNANRTDDIIYIFGDIQDTPDTSKNFHYGSCRIPKHPLGIVKICENSGLTCSIYQHFDTLEKPIISRHGVKGGRFIDGMFTSIQELDNHP